MVTLLCRKTTVINDNRTSIFYLVKIIINQTPTSDLGLTGHRLRNHSRSSKFPPKVKLLDYRTDALPVTQPKASKSVSVPMFNQPTFLELLPVRPSLQWKTSGNCCSRLNGQITQNFFKYCDYCKVNYHCTTWKNALPKSHCQGTRCKN